MPKCFIFGCSNGYESQRKSPAIKVSLFAAPKDNVLFDKWRKAAKAGRSHKLFSKQDSICSNHFLEEDIIKGKTDFAGDFYPSKRWHLKEGAVPILGKGIVQNYILYNCYSRLKRIVLMYYYRFKSH